MSTAPDPFAPDKKEDVINMVDTAPDTKNEVSATIKAGAGFDAPWYVLRSDTPENLNKLLTDAINEEVVQNINKVAVKLQESWADYSGDAPKKPARQGQPQGSTQPPAGAPECPPGWEFRTGFTKKGKPYKGYFPPRGSNEKPIWL